MKSISSISTDCYQIFTQEHIHKHTLLCSTQHQLLVSVDDIKDLQPKGTVDLHSKTTKGTLATFNEFMESSDYFEECCETFGF